ncbi:MAG: hypothetical protein SFW64_02570 [Alphaproteobacteria bacterium]|nr:hypothetical protein [Alphaproteobacteria bacterium]
MPRNHHPNLSRSRRKPPCLPPPPENPQSIVTNAEKEESGRQNGAGKSREDQAELVRDVGEWLKEQLIQDMEQPLIGAGGLIYQNNRLEKNFNKLRKSLQGMRDVVADYYDTGYAPKDFPMMKGSSSADESMRILFRFENILNSDTHLEYAFRNIEGQYPNLEQAIHRATQQIIEKNQRPRETTARKGGWIL